jgi:hypothetical protein
LYLLLSAGRKQLEEKLRCAMTATKLMVGCWESIKRTHSGRNDSDGILLRELAKRVSAAN